MWALSVEKKKGKRKLRMLQARIIYSLQLQRGWPVPYVWYGPSDKAVKGYVAGGP